MTVFRPQTLVVTQNQVTCRLDEYFRQPDRFVPERWLKDSAEYEPVSPYLVLPFGHGPRACIARRLSEQFLLVTLIKVKTNKNHVITMCHRDCRAAAPVFLDDGFKSHVVSDRSTFWNVVGRRWTGLSIAVDQQTGRADIRRVQVQKLTTAVDLTAPASRSVFAYKLYLSVINYYYHAPIRVTSVFLPCSLFRIRAFFDGRQFTSSSVGRSLFVFNVFNYIIIIFHII